MYRQGGKRRDAGMSVNHHTETHPSLSVGISQEERLRIILTVSLLSYLSNGGQSQANTSKSRLIKRRRLDRLTEIYERKSSSSSYSKIRAKKKKRKEKKRKEKKRKGGTIINEVLGF